MKETEGAEMKQMVETKCRPDAIVPPACKKFTVSSNHTRKVLQDLTNNAVAVNQQLTTEKHQNQKKDSLIETQKIQMQELQEQLRKYGWQIHQLHLANQYLKTDLNVKKLQSEKVIVNQNATMQKLHEKLAKAKHRIRFYETTNQSLTSSVQKDQTIIANLNEKMDTLQSQLATQKQQIQSHETTNHGLTNALKNTQCQLNEVHKSWQEQVRIIRDLKRQLSCHSDRSNETVF